MEFDWDPAKDATNRKKHGISFEEITEVFGGPGWDEWIDRDPGDDEVRYMTVGRLGWKIVSVVYTERGNFIRLISAREANSFERRAFRQSEATT